jgi:hypothetical protein
MNKRAIQKLLRGSTLVGLFSLGTAPNAWAQTLALCNGGAQEALSGIVQIATASTAAVAFSTLPSSAIEAGASGGATDDDLYKVTLSGEGDNTAGGFEVQAQFSINGGAFSNMRPVGPATFHSGTNESASSMTWCRRLAASASLRIQIIWRKVGGGTAFLDDYTVLVERSN